MLCAFDWPGNVRQLENSVFRAVVLCEGDELQMEDFPQISGLTPQLSDMPNLPTPANDLAPVQVANTGNALIEIYDATGELRELEAIERDLIQLAIEHYEGHMSEVSRQLGIGRSTLYRKVREYDLNVPDKKEAG